MARRGSSPLARGLHCDAHRPQARARIIPARAGFTASRARIACASSDHPRSRGVYCAGNAWVRACAGSSPLARGLPPRPRTPSPSAGIIPARAGFTSAQAGGVIVQGDHPRSRGVYTAPPTLPASRGGSSPLARGLRGLEGAGPLQRRIIPARAGFTPHRSPRPGPRGDHPRSRGVYGRTI